VSFSEEFNGSALDTSKLTPCFDWNYGGCTSSFNSGKEHYQPSQVRLSNGTAKLVAEPLSPPLADSACYNGQCTYKAGLVSTARPNAGNGSDYLYKFTYGYIESRMKFPGTPGFFTAFWMIPANTSYNYAYEIDIVEILGGYPDSIFMNYHYNNRGSSYTPNNGAHNNGACAVRDYSTDFVRFGLDWQPTYVAWYIDGVKCGQFNGNSTTIANVPMQLILHMMIDNQWERDWGSVLSSQTLVRQLEVDYIRVYQQVPTATPSPTPTPSPTAPMPTTGFPDASNTGPVAGTVFQDRTGVYEVRGDNLVVNGLRVMGTVLVYGNNVTIQNCDVNASGHIWGIKQESGSGLKVKNCHIYGIPSKTDYSGTHVLSAIEGATEMAFNNIHGVENGISNGTGYIHDNYIHDFANWVAIDNHTDGVQTYGSAGQGGLRVIHNTIIAMETGGDFTPTNYQGGSSAIALSEGMHDLIIDNNLFAGGSYTLYGPSQAGSSPANVRVTNNRFSTQYFQKCGTFGTHAGFNSSAPGFVWSGNVWNESGQVLPY
jgi:hypothetical protein